MAHSPTRRSGPSSAVSMRFRGGRVVTAG